MIDQLPQNLTTPIPANETERLAALHRYKILDTPPEAAFDRITTLAARLFNMPIALISLVDESRAWFKSCIGFTAREVPRDATLCSFAVLTNEPLIISDTRLDERFACNPFVQSEPGVRFYAGAPLLSRDGFNLGTLCLLDTQPRNWFSAEQQATLVDLAAMVVDELELRLAAHKIAQVDAALLEVTQGVATVTGEAYFDALVQHFAKVLDADYVYIGLIEGDNSTKTLRTIATYAHGQIVENLKYPLQETPCWEVLQQRKICCYPRHVQAQFPNAPLLKPLSVESYVAIPFSDSSGRILGLLGVMDGKPLENVQLAESLLTIFAQRIATELERQLFEQERERFLAVGSDLQVITRADGYFHWVSPSFERLLGWTVEEMTSRPWTDFVHPDDISPSVSETSSLFCGSKTLAFENRYRHKDCSYRWLLWKAQPYPEEQLLYGAAVDITERKQAEQALRLSAARFRTLISASSNVLYRMNADWSEMQELQGGNFIADTFEPIHDWLQRYIYPDDQERVLETIAAAIQNKHLFELEHRVHQADGTLGWTYSRAVPLLDSFGEIIEWFGEASDISARKRIEQEREYILHYEQTARSAAEQANQERKAQLQQAFEFGAMLGRVIDKVRDSLDESQILQTVVKELALVLNVICCNTAVYDLEQGTSTICYEYAVKDPGAQKRTTQIAADSGIYQQLLQRQYSQFCSLTPNPVRGRVAMLACPIFDDRGVLGDLWLINQSDYVFNELEIRLVQQVTDQCAIAIRQARLYQAATAQIKELERLNQLKDDFLSTVSHELRTPIANMKMAIAMLKVAPNSEKQERYLNILQAECARESEMINDLLDLQRLELEFCTNSLSEAINLQEMLPKIVEPFYVRAGQRQQTLQLDLPLELPAIICNHVSLERIIVELINNACKYTGAGGDIVLGIRYEPTQIATIFTISNSAEIPQDQLPRIFDKFYRVPRGDRWQQGGTGLGLALVQKLVEQMQGNISVVCSDGWTNFTVTLPNRIKTS